MHSSYFFLINSGRYWEHEPLHHTTGGIQPLVHAWSFKETPETAPKRCKQELREQPFLPSGCSKQSPSRGDFRKLPALIASPAALGSGSRVAPQPLTLLSSMCAASPDPPRRSPCTRSRRNRPPAAAADTGAHGASEPPAAAAITRRHVCVQPRNAVALAERCTLGSIVLFGPVVISHRPDGDKKNYNSQQTPQRRGAAIGRRLAGRANYISQEAAGLN